MKIKNIIFRIIILFITLFLFNVSYLYSEEKAVDFTLKSIDGKEMILSDLLKNKKVVLVFWATWCPHCRSEIPHIEKFYKENKNEVIVIGINVGESKARVTGFVKKREISYPILLDSDSKVAKTYKIRGVPAVIAIDKDGTILYSGHSIIEMKKKIYGAMTLSLPTSF